MLFIVCFSNIGCCLNVQENLDELTYVQLRISEKEIEMYYTVTAFKLTFYEENLILCTVRTEIPF